MSCLRALESAVLEGVQLSRFRRERLAGLVARLHEKTLRTTYKQSQDTHRTLIESNASSKPLVSPEQPPRRPYRDQPFHSPGTTTTISISATQKPQTTTLSARLLQHQTAPRKTPLLESPERDTPPNPIRSDSKPNQVQPQLSKPSPARNAPRPDSRRAAARMQHAPSHPTTAAAAVPTDAGAPHARRRLAPRA